MSLKQLKGRPQTLDVVGLRRDLARLARRRDGGAGQEAALQLQLPRYDRVLHEPRPDGPVVGGATCVVLVEGIHLGSRIWG